MIWFLLFGAIGYIIYKLYKRRWFRQLQREIAEFKELKYISLVQADKQRVRKLVNSIFNSGMTLDDETSVIVSQLYQEIEQEDFLRDGFGLSETQSHKRSRHE